MSKRSTATVREAPVARVPAATGGLIVHAEDLGVETRERVEIIDVTDRLMAHVRAHPIREGALNLWSMHTTCGLFINESQPALLHDIRHFFEELVARDHYYRHNDPEYSDCDRSNADAHLRALVLGHALSLQVSGGEIVLGQWQRILMAELDGPRARTLRVQLLGLG